MNIQKQWWRLSILLQFMLSAVSSAQSMVVWGDDSYAATDVPAGLTNVVAISAHGGHSLALKAEGTIASWGTDHTIELSEMIAYADVPAWVPPGVTNVVAMATGATHSLALLRDGTVASWSHFSSGQVTVQTMQGTGTNLSSPAGRKVHGWPKNQFPINQLNSTINSYQHQHQLNPININLSVDSA